MTTSAPTLAFIGAGNMASSIFGGLVSNGWPADKIIAAEPAREKLDEAEQKFGIRTTTDNAEAISEADFVVIAVKPQIMQQVLKPLAPALQERKPVLISVAAGISEQSLSEWSGGNLPIVRCMPNTPALMQQGASGLYANAHVSEEQKKLTTDIMNAVGISLWVEREEDIDNVIALSGSGPAYFFLMMEAMIDAGEKMGVPRETASQLVAQTALGAAMMVKETGVDAGELKRRVMSPKGTTEQAIFTFEDGGLRELVEKAMANCHKRAQEMTKEFTS
ncbi:pyrroline-5-carboxylate reductase [Sansalvadorimonas sp. 2012CJ34-2]|uniref:Pyrroline-5-carboxylate reductase n=1 Tax=Parendozoicomonas callyspongiae TaxID=2942213 RepID=A0ABT0PAN7_9GAMM|nr:pyrroline-5-carboxylate reductase [Sansalvadorimonas sp. 2012CJ34-2]MCL6268458.1 pyrroline-5-carboxylate reductase [Sansalvadorimonas sp. 2012CJ34-2]